MEELQFHWTDIHKVICLIIFQKSVEKIKFYQSLPGMTGTVHEDLYTFLIISRSVILRIRNISEKNVKKIQTFFVLDNFFFEYRSVYEIMCENIVEPGRSQIILRIHSHCVLDT
jgi:hypothetical protein